MYCGIVRVRATIPQTRAPADFRERLGCTQRSPRDRGVQAWMTTIGTNMGRIAALQAGLLFGSLCVTMAARAVTAPDGLQRFRETYKELVETNTTLFAGDCTLAAQRMAVRLKAAGHATNALPQRATANINCRIFPGDTRDAVLAQLVAVIDDPKVSVTIPEIRGPIAAPAPLTPQILKPIEKVAHELWPGVPVVPALEPGASDAQFLNPAGIPTYGVSGIFTDPDGGGIHGLNERVRVQSVYEGRTFLYRLVKLYADQ